MAIKFSISTNLPETETVTIFDKYFFAAQLIVIVAALESLTVCTLIPGSDTFLFRKKVDDGGADESIWSKKTADMWIRGIDFIAFFVMSTFFGIVNWWLYRRYNRHKRSLYDTECQNLEHKKQRARHSGHRPLIPLIRKGRTQRNERNEQQATPPSPRLSEGIPPVLMHTNFTGCSAIACDSPTNHGDEYNNSRRGIFHDKKITASSTIQENKENIESARKRMAFRRQDHFTEEKNKGNAQYNAMNKDLEDFSLSFEEDSTTRTEENYERILV